MRIVAAIVALLVTASLAMAQGTLSVPYTAGQQAGVQWSLDKVNADRANQVPPLPPITLANYGISLCQDVYTDLENQRSVDQELQADIRTKYLARSDADKAAIEAYIDSCISMGSCP